MRKLNKVLPASLAIALLSACATTPDLSPDERAIVAGNWTLMSVADTQEEVRLRPQLSMRHTINFERDGSLTMQLDCNRGTSNWSTSSGSSGSGRLEISRIAATRAFCPSPSYGERMAAELPRTEEYRLDAGARTLTIYAADTVYTFQSM